MGEAAFLALYHPDVEVDLSRSGIPDGGIHHGHDGLRAAWARWRASGTARAVPDADPRSLEGPGPRHRGPRAGEVYTVRDGLIVHFVNFLDRDNALREAGLG